MILADNVLETLLNVTAISHRKLIHKENTTTESERKKKQNEKKKQKQNMKARLSKIVDAKRKAWKET